MNKAVKKLLKIGKWVVLSVLILIVLVVLLLSVLFPDEYVKGIVVDNLRNQLGREVLLRDFSFNVFKGIQIKGLEIKERELFGSGAPFVKIEALTVDYSVLPLLGGTFVLNEGTLKGLEVHIIAKKINGQNRFNFDDLFQVPASAEAKEEPVAVESAEPAKPPVMKKPGMPLAFSLGKVGLEDAKIEFKDYTNPILPAVITVDKVTAVLTDLNSALSPFGIDGGLQLSFAELKEGKEPKKNFNIFVGLAGKIKPFNLKSMLEPEVDLKFSVKDFLMEGSFLQTAINNGMKLALRDFINQIDKNLPALTNDIKKQLQPTIDKQLNNLEAEVKKLKEEQGFTQDALKKEKEKTLADLSKELDPSLDKAMVPILGQADKLPAAVKDKAKKEVIAQKEGIKKSTMQAVSKELDKVIASADKEFEKQLGNLKNSARDQIDKIITAAIKEAAKELRSWAVKLEKNGLGLGFLSGKISFDGGSVGIHVKEWLLKLADIDLVGEQLGIKGDMEYGIFTEQGFMKVTLLMNAGLDFISLFEPFKKGDKIEIPVDLTFNNKTGEYKLNNSIISGDQLKKVALDYGVAYAERMLGVGGTGKDAKGSSNTEKYQKAMQDLKKGKVDGAITELGKTGETLKKYEKAAKDANKAGKAVKKLFK